MRKRVRKKLVFGGMLLVSIFLGSLFPSVTYADSDRVNFQLELSPASRRMTLKPGEEKKDNIQLKNIGTDTLHVEMYATAYSADNGAALQDEILSDEYTKISEWITFKDLDGKYYDKIQLEIEPNETKNIRYAVKVPPEAVGGGQYGIIFAEFSPTGEPDASKPIQARSRSGMSLLAVIDDDGFIREAQITNVRSPRFVVGRNIGVEYTVKNNGNIDFQSSVEMVVNSIFGEELYRNTFVETILPENSKDVAVGWSDTPSFGLFRLDYTIHALDVTEEGGHIVLAISASKLALAIILIITIAVVISYFVRRKNWRKRRAMIEKE